jgi:hypothetical protein
MEAVKRCLNILASLSGSVTIEAQKGLDQFVMHWIKQGKQKGIDQHHHTKQLQTRF